MVEWATFELVGHATTILQSYADELVELGHDDAAMERQLDKSVNALCASQYTWLTAQDGLLLICDGVPRWRRAARSGQAARRWDARPKAKARAAEGVVRRLLDRLWHMCHNRSAAQFPVRAHVSRTGGASSSPARWQICHKLARARPGRVR
ncbi:MAG: hypothetical protein U1F43_37880 [Myxococcota bacterium]